MGIYDAIIKTANSKKTFKTNDVLVLLKHKFSRQAVSAAISSRVDSGVLIRSGKGPNTTYALPKNADGLANVVKQTFKNIGLAEHEVLMGIKDNRNFWRNIPENVDSIFAYAFSEMVNNAIDHSKSDKIAIEVIKSDTHLIFKVRDRGIGVFRNIMNTRRLKSEFEAIQDLMKGKTTTAPQAHSGEGIFFTSKIADEFILSSFDKQLRIDNNIHDIFIEERKPQLRGTNVMFSINLKTQKHLSDIFQEFQSEPNTYAFDKTEIQVKLYQTGTIYISRSQAKRLLSGLEKFKKIILDFDKVPTAGQAFCDEIFRVFQLKHPRIEIIPINMIQPVEFMVKRVDKP